MEKKLIKVKAPRKPAKAKPVEGKKKERREPPMSFTAFLHAGDDLFFDC